MEDKLTGSRKRLFSLERTEELRQEASEAIAERDALLSAVFESARDGMFIVDSEGRYVDVNPAGCEMFGYEKEEFLSSDISMLLFPEDVKAAFKKLKGTTEAVLIPEQRMRRKNGEQLWVEFSVNPFKVGGKKYYLGIKRDITDKKLASELLLDARDELEELVGERTEELSRANRSLRAEVEERLRRERILRAILEGTSSVAGGEYMKSLTKYLATSLGFKYAIVGEWRDTDPGVARTLAVWAPDGFKDNFTYGLDGTPCETVIGREPCVYHDKVSERFPEDEILSEMGVECYVGVPLFDSSGSPIGLIITMDDKPLPEDTAVRTMIEVFAHRASLELERKRYEEELRRNEERLKEAQKIAHFGNWEWDIQEDRIYWSDEVFSIFELDPGEFEPSYEAFVDMVHPGDREVVKKAVNDALYRGKPYSVEHRLVLPDGRVKFLHEHARVTWRDGEPVMMYGTVQDVTEWKRMEEEVLKGQKLESIGILAGGIAHEFNNLLLGIIGNISVAKGYLDPKDRVYGILDRVEQAADKAKGVTKQILTFSKGGKPVREPVRVEGLVKGTAELLLKNSDIGLRTDFPEDLWQVEVDEGQMSQVFNNLILNARQAVSSGGDITITSGNVTLEADSGLALEPGYYVRVTVRDTGSGIPPEDLPRIFDPFFTTKDKASGLGLAVSYSIVKKHKGLITADSTPGKGSVFHVYLPAASAAGEGAEEVEFDAPADGRVLVMDDEKLVRDVSAEMLELMGFEAVFAEDGHAAVDEYKRALDEGRPFNAVIMDLSVPGGMGGKEAVKEVLALDPDARVIVSSGYSRDPIMSDYAKYGFKAVMAKPYRVSDFSRTVKKVVSGD